MFFTRTSCAVRTGKSGILFSIPLFFLRRVCYNGASIMKKVHSAGFRPVTFVHFCHHTPQGDVGKHNTATAKPSPAPITPRKGTLELSAIANKGFGNGKSHPARGRWNFRLKAVPAVLRTPSHPARGRWKFPFILQVGAQTNVITPRKGTQTTAPLCCTVSCGEAGRLLFCEISGCFPLEDLSKKRSEFLLFRRFSLSNSVL